MRSFASFFFALTVALHVPRVAANCKVDLDNHPCLSKCVDNIGDFYVCDLTVPWLHHYSFDSQWLPATPPEGTGKHEYAVFKGSFPPCAKLGECPACEAPTGTKVCSVLIDPDADCSKECGETVSGTESAANDDGRAATLAALATIVGAAMVM